MKIKFHAYRHPSGEPVFGGAVFEADADQFIIGAVRKRLLATKDIIQCQTKTRRIGDMDNIKPPYFIEAKTAKTKYIHVISEGNVFTGRKWSENFHFYPAEGC